MARAAPAAERVRGVRTPLLAHRGAPAHGRSANGPAVVAPTGQFWLAPAGVRTGYIEPGKPGQTGTEERLTGTVRDACLNRLVLGSVAAACVRLARFRPEYNTERPPSARGSVTPQADRAA